jgi:hypothetical protein
MLMERTLGGLQDPHDNVHFAYLDMAATLRAGIELL